MRVAVEYPGALPSPADVLLRAGTNLVTGVSDFEARFGEATSLESDLLTFASSVFAADVAVKRGMREDIVRDMDLTVPVVNIQAFEARRAELEEILFVLSHDNWTLSFVQHEGNPEPKRKWPEQAGTALLFSGGLDSLAAAVELLDAHTPGEVLLASHVTRNPTTISSQKRLHSYLEGKYGSIQRVVVRTGGKDTDELEFASGGPEVTQRTRSLMFLTIATLAARRAGMSKVVMIAENGQMAIHLPLSSGRIGTFSTHTAHPTFVSMAERFFSDTLRFPFKFDNPFLYKTKAEVVANLARNHPDAIPLSVSCWKSSRVASGHCGECVPCYVRRVALESNGCTAGDWARDVFAEEVGALPDTDEGKRNLMDLAGFASDFRTLSPASLEVNYCELYSDDFDRTLALAMYQRFAVEAFAVMSKYKGLASLL